MINRSKIAACKAHDGCWWMISEASGIDLVFLDGNDRPFGASPSPLEVFLALIASGLPKPVQTVCSFYYPKVSTKSEIFWQLLIRME